MSGRPEATPHRLTGAVAAVDAAHPYPIAMVVALTRAVSLLSDPGRAEAGRTGLTVLAMLFAQLAIGWVNDYVDRDFDTRFQPEKPVARGDLQAGSLRYLSFAALGSALALGLILG